MSTARGEDVNEFEPASTLRSDWLKPFQERHKATDRGPQYNVVEQLLSAEARCRKAGDPGHHDGALAHWLRLELTIQAVVDLQQPGVCK
jgi:hypothetical protein